MPSRERSASFSPDDAPLRDDVGLLGQMLGEILVEQGGALLFDRVEAARTAAIEHRESGGSPNRLASSLNDLEPGLARQLVRAFSAYFSLTNLAEQVHRIRRRQAYLRTPNHAQRGSLRAVVDTMADAGLSQERVVEIFNDTVVSPVFTAHPTQATRRTILSKEQRIARMMADRFLTSTTGEDRRMVEKLRTEATLIWQTEEQPSQRPSVADEVESVLFTLTDVVYRVIPAFFDALREAVDGRFGDGASQALTGPRLCFGSWVGGDMDGNPNVGGHTIRATLARHRELIITRYRQEIRSLFDHLSQSVSRIGVSPAVSDLIAARRHTMPALTDRIPSRYDDMPYRVVLWLSWERLGATLEDAEHAYLSADELVSDLEVVASSLAANRGASAGLDLVRRLLDRVRTFGFHLATLDLRQDALLHRQVCGELLREPSFESNTASERSDQLSAVLASPRLSLPEELSSPAAATLDVFRAVGECRRLYGTDAIGPMIISMAQGADDVLAVLALARFAGLEDARGVVPLDVAPLFETVDDLDNAGATTHAILSHPAYREHLRARGDEQIIMLGYSDSSKISGIAASRWALYRAQEQLVRIAGEHSVALTLFHGRGGTVGRGGSKPRDGIFASPCGSVRGHLRVTEQGEIINGKYGLRGIAERTLEVTVGAVAEASAECSKVPEPDARWRTVMDEIASASRTAYTALIHDHPDVVDYFRTATPIDVIERMNIGSRPASRRSGRGVENLRAIPWVFAWMQNRHLLPGWFGLGAGLHQAREDHGSQILVEMAEGWPFFATMLGDVAMVLAKADMGIASAYAELAGDAGVRIFPEIRASFERCLGLVLETRRETALLDLEPVLQRSIRLRNPYVDPMSLVQVDLLSRWRDGGRSDRELESALFETVRGIARGMRNTG